MPTRPCAHKTYGAEKVPNKLTSVSSKKGANLNDTSASALRAWAASISLVVCILHPNDKWRDPQQ